MEPPVKPEEPRDDVNIASSSEVVLDVSTISRIDNYCQKAIASAKIKEL